MKKPSTLAGKILAQQRALDIGKLGYERSNALLEELVPLMKGKVVKMPDGSLARLVDKFGNTNRIGAGLGVNRYEIEIERIGDIKKQI